MRRWSTRCRAPCPESLPRLAAAWRPGSRRRGSGSCGSWPKADSECGCSHIWASLSGSTAAGRTAVATPTLDSIDLSDREFWSSPPHHRHAVFDLLRRESPFAFFAEPVVPNNPVGPGYHAVTRYADVEAISCRPTLIASGSGADSITDMPTDLNENSGS